jgi:hypothetical protein
MKFHRKEDFIFTKFIVKNIAKSKNVVLIWTQNKFFENKYNPHKDQGTLCFQKNGPKICHDQ